MFSRVFLFAVFFLAPLLKADSLYAVSTRPEEGGLSRTPHNSLYLYRLDDSSSGMTMVRKIAEDPGLVIVDLERSIVVCGFPSIYPMKLSILDTSSPTSLRSVDLSYDSLQVNPYEIIELDEPGDSLYLAMALGHLTMTEQAWATSWTAFDLRKNSAPVRSMPGSAMSHLSRVRFMGFVGDRYQDASQEYYYVDRNPLELGLDPKAGASDIPAPPVGAEGAAHADVPYILQASNDEFLVLRRHMDIGNAAFDVFDEQSRAWSKLVTPFPVLSVRAFGAWLAFIGGDNAPGTRIPVAPSTSKLVLGGDQMGDPEKRRSLISAYRTSVEEELEASGHSHSGKLLLRNPRTGVEFTIDTGEADSEIVYADDHTVVYRTNDELFQSDLLGTKLQPAKRIASGRSVVGVHWMFVGPDAQ